jgi:hypothetical protein
MKSVRCRRIADKIVVFRPFREGPRQGAAIHDEIEIVPIAAGAARGPGPVRRDTELAAGALRRARHGRNAVRFDGVYENVMVMAILF